MSSIMRARNGLMGRSEVSEVIGALSRAEGCWTFDARDRMPLPSRDTAHHLVENAPTETRAPLPRERVRSSAHRGHSTPEPLPGEGDGPATPAKRRRGCAVTYSGADNPAPLPLGRGGTRFGRSP